MATEREVQDRIAQLLPSRWKELLADASPLDRRSKTLGVCASIRETLQLCRLNVSKDEEEFQGKRGEVMRPDSAQESVSLLTADRAARMAPELKEALRGSLQQVTEPKGKASRPLVAQIQSLFNMFESSYPTLLVSAAEAAFNSTAPSLVDFEEAIENLVTYARGRGWSDTGLTDLLEKVQEERTDPLSTISELTKIVSGGPQEYNCGVTVRINGFNCALLEIPEHGVSIQRRTDEGAMMVAVVLRACDPWAAAREALMRISSILGAANIFSPSPAMVDNSGKVVVSRGDLAHEIFPVENLRRDPHHPRTEQVKTIIELSARATRQPTTDDSLYQAVRNHHRAIESSDIESSSILLWAGLERMCVSATRPEPALRITADLVSSALAFGKIRREISSLSEGLTAYLKGQGAVASDLMRDVALDVVREDRKVVGHDLLLEALMDEDGGVRRFLAPFHADVRLTQWFYRLRKKLCGTSKFADKVVLRKTVPELINASRQKISWQVLRVYRARNGLAHGVDRPLWLSDLARHANYFLTNLLAICINYASSSVVAPFDVLSERKGRLDAYLELVRAGDSRALSIDGMLRPSKLFKE